LALQQNSVLLDHLVGSYEGAMIRMIPSFIELTAIIGAIKNKAIA
jgi:hypothetical protein